mmetsp:Transcript_12894/g.26112  ORF Transcript_12894/g.26112 Transcript_12894/m.26112 type:complete len:336 (-) Transcript_12894:281-1288(-)
MVLRVSFNTCVEAPFARARPFDFRRRTMRHTWIIDTGVIAERCRADVPCMGNCRRRWPGLRSLWKGRHEFFQIAWPESRDAFPASGHREEHDVAGFSELWCSGIARGVDLHTPSSNQNPEGLFLQCRADDGCRARCAAHCCRRARNRWVLLDLEQADFCDDVAGGPRCGAVGCIVLARSLDPGGWLHKRFARGQRRHRFLYKVVGRRGEITKFVGRCNHTRFARRCTGQSTCCRGRGGVGNGDVDAPGIFPSGEGSRRACEDHEHVSNYSSQVGNRLGIPPARQRGFCRQHVLARVGGFWARGLRNGCGQVFDRDARRQAPLASRLVPCIVCLPS